jgi:ACS family hexuronate transporter-like MFS transporter
MSAAAGERSDRWRYSVCGLLLLATMLNYMDRQTLSQLAPTIQEKFGLNNTEYAQVDSGFSLAFATGVLFFGVLADWISVRWLYPLVLIGWSFAGIATGFADSVGTLVPHWVDGLLGLETERAGVRDPYLGFMLCRVLLGLFEAGHWPCALVTTQTILTRRDRSFGNSILQSGAALGAIFTPPIVRTMLTRPMPGQPLDDSWRLPFFVIGLLGLLWVVPWLAMVRGRDLVRFPQSDTPGSESAPAIRGWPLVRCFIVLIIVVVTINAAWQFYRVWLPLFLEKEHHFSRYDGVIWITSAYYIAADTGCIAVGITVKWLAGRGWDVHRARLLLFALCTGLVLLSLIVAVLPAPAAERSDGWLLIGLLLLIGAGALGLFPNYYAFTQELSRKHQGKVSGSLGTISWIGSAVMQPFIGRSIDSALAAGDPNPYALGIVLAGIVPTVALLAMLFAWPRLRHDPVHA